QWVFRSGYPQIKARCIWKERERKLEIHALQTQRISDDNPAFKIPLEIRIEGRGWVKNFTKLFDQKEHRWEFKLPSEPLNYEVDPDQQLLKKLDTQKPLRMWEHQLLHAPRAMSRIYAAQALSQWPGQSAAGLISRALRR